MVKNNTNQPVFETGENKDVSLTANPAVTNCSIDELLLSLDPESANIVKQRMLEIEHMKKKQQEYLDNHPYKPTKNKNGRFYTRFLVDGRLVQRNRKSLDEINSLIISYYENGGKLTPEEGATNVYSFEKAHDRWLEMQEEYGQSDNTIYRYEADWKRFFDGTDFAKRDIGLITAKDIELFMINAIKTHNLKRQAGVTLFGYITGVFYNAVMDERIDPDKDPCRRVDKKKFKKFYNTEQKTVEERTMSPQNIRDLVERLNADLGRKEDCLPAHAVKLALLTGMRSGEICGLRWENVHEDYIHVCESEKYNSKKKEYFQSGTKTGKIRDIPMTPELKKYFEIMRNFQERYGCLDGFVISTGTEKCRTRKLSDYMIKRSKALGFGISKNIHTIRRTFNSFMRADGASALTAGSILGNTVEVNNNNYTYDVDEMHKKSDTIQRAETRLLGSVSLFDTTQCASSCANP